MSAQPETWLALCSSDELVDSGLAVPFDVVYQGQACTAFAIRYQGQVRAYLNRCTHVAMEMDWMPNRFFSSDGQWLLCATHGATHDPLTGACAGGPCNSGLTLIRTQEDSGRVFWQPQYELRAVDF
jgi:nitrite reductase/ring-hydroxylating ferredoxin subunit